MGITERKEREKAEMREKILAAAMKLFVRDGWEKTSIRKIANEIEYSPGTIYLYFKDKNELFFDLHAQGFAKFRIEFEKAQFLDDPFERLKFIGRNYIHFALKNPEMYDLMFLLRSPMNHLEKGESWHLGKGAFQILEDTVKECLEKGLIKGGDYHAVSYAMWGQVHGLVSLSIRGRMEMYEGEDEEYIFSALDYIMDSIKA